MKRKALIRLFAGLFVAILFAAHTGQQIHIHNEDHAHYAAHCNNPVSGDETAASVVAKCYVDNFDFFSFLEGAVVAPSFYCGELGVLQPEATQCKHFELASCLSLRAPPAV